MQVESRLISRQLQRSFRRKKASCREAFVFDKNMWLRKIARLGSLDDLARLQAGGADADALVSATYAGADGAQVNVPATAADIVRVADLVSKLRAFAADVANLCHLNDSRNTDSVEARSLQSA